ncbi:MAG TPA: hypothetical protein PLV45_14295 [bacterium]|nr:hypothetical protein [bacterium]
MRVKDYVFRCIGLLIVWGGLAFPAVTSDLFVPTDFYDFALAAMLIIAGLFLTLAIWIGPEVFHLFNKKSGH